MLERDYIIRQALSVGFNCCGIARCRSLDHQKENFSRWLSLGYDSGMEYLSRNFDKRFDPATLVEGAKSVIVCAVSYKNEYSVIQKRDNGDVGVASFALSRDYHVIIKEMLEKLYASIKHRWPNVSGRCFVDSAPILEKAWAVEAGLGWVGNHSLLINPRFGSFVLLGEIVIDTAVDSYDSPIDQAGCAGCTLCMNICPGKAISEPRIVDTGSCIARLTIEKGAPDAREESLKGWVFGCDLCQSVCPHNRKTPFFTNNAFAPVVHPNMLTRVFWKNISETDFKRMFGSTPMIRAGYENIRKRIFSEEETEDGA